MTKMRLTFEKGEATRYVGHLDVLRTFIRALRRAQIPVKYSEGFNPHALMTFALPLGVGVTSECELVDVTVTKQLPPEAVIERLNENLQAGGIKVTACEYTDLPFGEIMRAEYIIIVKTAEKADALALENALAQQEILVDKKSKKQTKQINIMEHIFESEVQDLGDEGFTLRAVISAGNSFNVKPQLVVAAIASVMPEPEIKNILPHRKRFIFQD